MSLWDVTRSSGTNFENELLDLLKLYTKNIWKNVLIDTYLTAQGSTEVDIIFCINDVVFIVEAKNVSSISGNYCDNYWSFVGSKNTTSAMREYTSLNTITQNQIHARSFKDAYYSFFKEWPRVIPLIIVPNDCKLSDDLLDSVFSISDLSKFCSDIVVQNTSSKLHRRVSSMINSENRIIRPEFN